MDERTAQASGLMKVWQPKTRGDCMYQIYAIHEGQDFPIHGAVKRADGQWSTWQWMINGRSYLFDETYPYDLLPALPEKRVLKGWVNVYENGFRNWHDTRDKADKGRVGNCIACLYIEREYTPDEGL